MHGANRLGGNGVANSTVFGGIAGDVMPGWVKAGDGGFHEPDQAAIDAAVALCRAPLGKPAAAISTPYARNSTTLMWDDVGIVRDAAGLKRAEGALDALEARLDATGVADSNLAFNLTWHDWMNLKNLILVSKSIRFAAMAREDSRGAHYRVRFSGCARHRKLALYLRHLERRPFRQHDSTGKVHPCQTRRIAAGRGLIHDPGG